jgi:hypothetical protein
LVIPILATVGRLFVSGGSKLKPLMKKVVNPRETNINFLKDYGKKKYEEFKMDPKGFQKHFDKVKGNPKEALTNFLKDMGTDSNPLGETGSSKVKMVLPEETDQMPSPETEKVKERGVPFGFNKITGLENLIREGRVFGSITMLLFVILFIIVAIRPVRTGSPETRLTLAFKSILGLTELDGLANEEDLENDSPSGFGGTGIEKLKEKIDSNILVIPTHKFVINTMLSGLGNMVDDFKNFDPTKKVEGYEFLTGSGNKGYGGMRR